MSHDHKGVCIHTIKSNYGVLSPGQHLKPINGKIIWHIEEATLTPDMEKYKTIYAFDQAFKKWGELLSPVVFEATGNIGQAQIVIRFKGNGDVGLPFPFENGVLAYAFSPSGESFGVAADMYFNEVYQWDEIHKQGSIYLFKVAVHELGHTLNIDHQTVDINDIMYPMYQPTGEVIMNDDTRKGIYDLYKNYGVQYKPLVPTVPPVVPTPTPPTKGVSQELKLFIKALFPSKTFMLRLTSAQLSSFGNILGITFDKRDTIISKVDKLWNIIITF